MEFGMVSRRSEMKRLLLCHICIDWLAQKGCAVPLRSYAKVIDEAHCSTIGVLAKCLGYGTQM